MSEAPGLVTVEVRQRPALEILLVLGISLGQSAVYSILSLIEKVTRNVALNEQTTSCLLYTSPSPRD